MYSFYTWNFLGLIDKILKECQNSIILEVENHHSIMISSMEMMMLLMEVEDSIVPHIDIHQCIKISSMTLMMIVMEDEDSEIFISSPSIDQVFQE